jgi:hypothetical protein
MIGGRRIDPLRGAQPADDVLAHGGVPRLGSPARLGHRLVDGGLDRMGVVGGVGRRRSALRGSGAADRRKGGRK